MSAHQNERDSQGFTVILWLVWGSMLFSLLIFASVPLLIPAPPDFTPASIAAGPISPLLLILGVATILLVPALINSRKKMFFDPALEAAYPSDEAVRSAYFTMSLTSWVFCELIGVFGLVMAYMTFDATLSLPFVAVAAVLLGVFRPRDAAVEAHLGGKK